MTKKLEQAFAHIKQFYPSVCIVAFSKNGNWHYMDEYFNSPVFGEEIEVGILEDAADSIINSSSWLPAIFQIEN
jgi:hypothetical protein